MKARQASLSLILTLTIPVGCASIPDGKKVLDAMVKTDARESVMRIDEGRPVFAAAYMYPQVLEGGDVFGGGAIYVYLGREKLSLNGLIEANTASQK